MYDPQKKGVAVRALLGVFEFGNGRAVKRFHSGVMDSLAEQGWISNPQDKAKSVCLTREKA